MNRYVLLPEQFISTFTYMVPLHGHHHHVSTAALNGQTAL